MSADPIPDVARSPRVTTATLATLRVDTVSDYDSLVALQPVWDRLLEEAVVDHPFLRHDWIRTWWECFGEGKRLHVLVVRLAGEPIAIAPLMLCRERFLGLEVRRLRLIANVHTQRGGFIIGRRPELAYRAIWECLTAQRETWDVLILPQLPAGSPTLDRLPPLAARDGFRVGSWRAPDSPYLPLAGTWDAYFNRLARKHRSNLRNRLKRLARLGPVELEVVGEGPQVGPALKEGLDIEAASWKGRAGTAIGCHPDLRRFYSVLAQRAAARGWLRLQFLTVAGRRIAFAYSLCLNRKLYLLKPGYDPAYSPYSPSNLLCYLVLREAFASGILAYDFLGADDPWKRNWTAEARPHFWLFVFGDAPRARLLYFIKFRLLPWLKRAYRAWSVPAARLRLLSAPPGDRSDGDS
jgi:CelD/BcsL family acetyltransferase involved in cellulose biosynthesis